MGIDRRLIAAAMTTGLVVALVSCDKSPTSPRLPQPPSAPGPAPGPTLVRVEIIAPPSIEPGASTQLRANAVKSDGSVEDVTSQSQWTSSDTRVLEIRVADGIVVTARARGEATITARYQSRSAGVGMMVLPNGTFRLTGVITDSGVPIEGVALEVIGGTGQGLTTVSRANGSYAFYGVGGDVRVRAAKQGDVNRFIEAQVTAHRAMDFEMALSGERRNLSGMYTLNLTAMCSANTTRPLPAEAQAGPMPPW